MKINFLMNIKLFDFKNEVEGNLKVIWRIVPENDLEEDILDFTERFLKSNFNEIKKCVLTFISTEIIFKTPQLKNLIDDKSNQTEIFLSYVDEKGGILSSQQVLITLNNLAELTKIPSKNSGITLSQKKLSEFLSEKQNFFD